MGSSKVLLLSNFSLLKIRVFEYMKKPITKWIRIANWSSLRVISESSIPYLGGILDNLKTIKNDRCVYLHMNLSNQYNTIS